MNFIEEFKKGQVGGNKGLYMGDGVYALNKVLNGLQKARILTIGAAPKVGKSTFVDYACVIQPYIYAMENNIPVEFIYFSFELDRISKEFDFAAYFLNHDHGISTVQLPQGVTKQGLSTLDLSPDYLRGRVLDDNNQTIKIDPKIYEALQIVYQQRIVPLFGEYSMNGHKLRNGVINFVETRNNPTGLYKFLQYHALQEGVFVRNGGETNSRITGYKPNNPNKYTIVITDHLRKLIPEQGFQLKQTIDKYIEYTVELRNLCGYTFVHIIHLNRNLTSIDRLREFEDQLYPNSDDVKDTGNAAEESDYMITMFNPNDLRYNLTKFFNKKLRDFKGDPKYPHLRSLHLVESRHCEYPQHFVVNMFGNLKKFEQIVLDDE